MQGALILNPSVYPIIAAPLAKATSHSIGRCSSFRLVVKSRRAAAQHHAQVYTPSQTRRLEICILRPPFEDIAIAVWRFRYDS
jgi:hypothetical protein